MLVVRRPSFSDLLCLPSLLSDSVLHRPVASLCHRDQRFWRLICRCVRRHQSLFTGLLGETREKALTAPAASEVLQKLPAGVADVSAHGSVDERIGTRSDRVKHGHEDVEVPAEMVLLVHVTNNRVGHKPEENHEENDTKHFRDLNFSLKDKITVLHISPHAHDECENEEITANYNDAGNYYLNKCH